MHKDYELRAFAIGIAVVLGGLTIAALTQAADTPKPPAVDQATQCRAYLELVVKDRANAQTEASYFAARTKDLTEANERLAQKVQDLEAKAKKDEKAK